jgi:hypothetical protein
MISAMHGIIVGASIMKRKGHDTHAGVDANSRRYARAISGMRPRCSCEKLNAKSQHTSVFVGLCSSTTSSRSPKPGTQNASNAPSSASCVGAVAFASKQRSHRRSGKRRFRAGDATIVAVTERGNSSSQNTCTNM